MQYTEPDNQQKVWYVMRSLYRTEFRTQALLQKAGIRSFIPVKETIVTSGGRRKRAKVPSVSNLIFVHSTQKELSPFTGADSRFQYTFRRGGLSNEPLIVPERQMGRTSYGYAKMPAGRCTSPPEKSILQKGRASESSEDRSTDAKASFSKSREHVPRDLS